MLGSNNERNIYCKCICSISIYDQTIFQPMKSAKFEAKEINFYAAERTGIENIVTFGNAQIFLYCDDILVDESISNSIGEWLIEFKIRNHSAYSNHLLYAKIVLTNGIEFNTKVKKLTYSRNYIDVHQIKLLGVIPSITFDYLKLNKPLSYAIYEGTYYIPFLVSFYKNDPNIIKDVYLTIQTLSNEVINLPCVYNKEKKLWIAKYKDTKNSPPIGIQVNYFCDEEFSPPEINNTKYISMAKEYKQILHDNIKPDVINKTKKK